MIITRRTFTLAALFGLPGPVGAQPRRARIGVLINGGPGPVFDGLRKTFQGLGYSEGTAIAFEPRFAEGTLDRLPDLARDLVRTKVDVILTLGGPASRAAKDATSGIPIVFSIVTDPVALRLVASMEKPGGNATGITSLDPEQADRQFALLRELLPATKRVAILSDVTIPGADAGGLAPIERANVAAGKAHAFEPFVVKLPNPVTDLEGDFRKINEQRAEALVVLEVPMGLLHRKRIAEIANGWRLPTLFPGSIADAGGLVTYGTSVADTWPRLPVIADKILKGAQPAELPVERISRRVLIVNLRTAGDIGVTVPESIIKRADRTL